MIGRADIEGSKSNVAMNAWPPQASYPCGNFSVTSDSKAFEIKGSKGPDCSFDINAWDINKVHFSPFGPREISVLTE